jgi:hypothetical protein
MNWKLAMTMRKLIEEEHNASEKTDFGDIDARILQTGLYTIHSRYGQSKRERYEYKWCVEDGEHREPRR